MVPGVSHSRVVQWERRAVHGRVWREVVQWGAWGGALPVTRGSGVPQLWPVLPPRVVVQVDGSGSRHKVTTATTSYPALNASPRLPLLPAHPSLLLPVV